MFKIVKREEMAEGTVILNEIEAPLIAKKAKPGQFVILKANEEGERIPLTMADTDPAKGTLPLFTWLLENQLHFSKISKSAIPIKMLLALSVKPPTSKRSARLSASVVVPVLPYSTQSLVA